MDRILNFSRVWAAPATGVAFAALWWLAERNRLPAEIITWDGLWPLVLITLSVCFSVRSPLVSLALTAALLIAQLAHVVPASGSTTWPMYIGVFIATGLTQWTGSAVERRIALIATAVYAAVMAFLMVSRGYGAGVGWFRVQNITGQAMGGEWWQCLAVLLSIGGGIAALGRLSALYDERRRLLGDQAQTQARLRDAEVELVLQHERARISRDLHDVLAHSLAVITAQADGSRYQRSDLPEDTVLALTTIADAARKAMADAQRVIAASSGEIELAPQPTLKDLDALVERSGLEVRRHVAGTPGDLSEMQELAAYRLIQESLTNALRHGKATAVDMTLSWQDRGLALSVRSPFPSGGTVTQGGTGRGIPGMKERALLAGGTLTAGPDGDNFVVEAFIPCVTSVEKAGGRDAAHVVPLVASVLADSND